MEGDIVERSAVGERQVSGRRRGQGGHPAQDALPDAGGHLLDGRGEVEGSQVAEQPESVPHRPDVPAFLRGQVTNRGFLGSPF